MKFMAVLLGILVLLSGLLPLLAEYGVFNQILPQGQIYYLIISVLGLLVLWYGLKRQGFGRFGSMKI